MSEPMPGVERAKVNDETMAAIRQQYDTLDRIILTPAYDGKAIKAEAWEAFQEIRLLRQAVDQMRKALVAIHDVTEAVPNGATAGIVMTLHGIARHALASDDHVAQ